MRAMRPSAWLLLCSLPILFAPACSGRYVQGDGAPGDLTHDVIDCADYLACNLDTPCDTGECVKVPGCGTAICASSAALCSEACGSTSCAVLDSYPAQLSSCPDGTPIKGRGNGFPADDPSTGGKPSVGGAPTGGYPAAGYGGSTSAGGSAPAGGYASGGTGYGGAVINCQSYQRCSIQVGCASPNLSCLSIPGCDLAICAPAQALCDNLCAGECYVLDSYPQQLECTTNAISGYEGYDMGAGGMGGSPYGYAGEAGIAGAYDYGGAAP